MEDNKKIVKNKDYRIGNFLEVEEYLAKERALGWKLTNYDGKNFIFEKCDPEQYIYKLDFLEGRSKEQASNEIINNLEEIVQKMGKVSIAEVDVDCYIQLFKDCGWEYVGTKNHFYCFCCPTAADMDSKELFSDNKSRIEMCRKIITHESCTLLIYSLIIIFVDALNIMNIFDAKSTGLSILINICSIVFYIAFIFLLACKLGDIHLLNKLMVKYSNPLDDIESKNAGKKLNRMN